MTMRLLNTACATYQTEELLVLLKSLVPEFRDEMAMACSSYS